MNAWNGRNEWLKQWLELKAHSMVVKTQAIVLESSKVGFTEEHGGEKMDKFRGFLRQILLQLWEPFPHHSMLPFTLIYEEVVDQFLDFTFRRPEPLLLLPQLHNCPLNEKGNSEHIDYQVPLTDKHNVVVLSRKVFVCICNMPDISQHCTQSSQHYGAGAWHTKTLKVIELHNFHRDKCLIHDRTKIETFTISSNHLLTKLLAHPHGWLVGPLSLSDMEHLAWCSVLSRNTESIGTWLEDHFEPHL